MSGDSYNLRANSWYRNNGASPASPVSPISSILSALAGGISAASGGKATAATLLSNNTLDPAVGNFLSNQTPISTRPKAFLNWILFDEQFKYVSGGFDQVGNDQEFKTHTQTALPITRNGYLYVYVSNETPNIDVFFDNVQITHIRGPLTEETHYYPFGGTLSAISSKAAGNLSNKYQYNGGNELQNKEFSDGSGLELYDAVHRLYDPQLGRFFQIDKLAELGIDFTPYGFARNNPIRMNDPLGLKEDTLNGTSPEVIVHTSKKKVASKQLNQMDYGQIAAWIDMRTKRGDGAETIGNWALNNPYLTPNTLDKILDANSSAARVIREAQDEAWKAEGELYKFFLTSILLTAGGELLMLAEFGEGATIAGEVTNGIVESANNSKVVGNLLKGFTRHGINQSITRGFKAADILKIIREGKVVQAMGRYGSQLRYSLGGNTVVINAQGKVVSVFSEAVKNGGKFIPF
ncbi:MAG: RHS repeat-associated core domain-containing protein [Sediminibacterium sp.]|jgi:RHS repeat-associated protein|nr:RHS repeat-associated core domain-containing protein [Chitinophagaceae bacterium]